MDGKTPQQQSPVNSSAWPLPDYHNQGRGVRVGSGNPLSQKKKKKNALNKDLMAQEGLLGAIILNSQNLIRDNKMLLEILLGSKTSICWQRSPPGGSWALGSGRFALQSISGGPLWP